MGVRDHLRGIRAVVFDVGETLVDETRMWSDQARQAGVAPLSLIAARDSLIERGKDHRQVWNELGVEPPRIAGQIEAADLYPDALSCLMAAKDMGLLVGIAGNQPRGIDVQLQSIGFIVDFIGSSAEWGVAKPSAGFFDRVVDSTAVKPQEILYVGDRVDNDVLPARSAGMMTAFLVRGPWARIHKQLSESALADLKLESLEELEDALH